MKYEHYDFKLKANFKPQGSQPEAITALSNGIRQKKKIQTLLGVTGSGKSLDYGETILIKNKEGFVEKAKIGEFVERRLINAHKIGETEYAPVSNETICSFNPSSHVLKEKEIIEISRHKEKYVYEIVLDDLSKVRVTKDHNCFRFTDLEFELCKTKDLKLGDYLPTSLDLPLPKKEFKQVNLLDYVDNKLAIKELVLQFDKDFSTILKLLKKYYKAPKWKLDQIVNETKERGVSKEEIKEYLEMLGVNLKEANCLVNIITKGNRKLHPLIKVDEYFLTFAGLYVSEGHNSGKYLLISNENPHLQEKCKKFFDSINLDYYQRDNVTVQYNSIILSNFFKDFGRTAFFKKIPSIIYNLSNKDLAIFLKSAFDGDGYVEENSVGFTSGSEELVNDIRNLLLRYAIASRIRIKKVNGKKFYVLTVSGRGNLLKFSNDISFSIGYKREKLKKIIKEKTNTNVDLIPNCSKFIRETRVKFKLSQKNLSKGIGCERSYISMLEHKKRHPSKKLFRKIIEYVSKEEPSYKKYLSLLNYGFRKIVAINKLNSTTGYVYDLSVKNNETFAAGYGNIFVHNTFTMANVIANTNKTTLVIAHNKTLAAQLYEEFKEFFPENRVEYFISYYDYYQPESYIPAKDQYIEKDSAINPRIEQMRHATTASLRSRSDVIVVASVSCIYGLGNPENYSTMGLDLQVGDTLSRNDLIGKLVSILYERNDTELMPGRFRVKGDTIDLIPGYANNIIRIELSGNEIERISELEKNTGDLVESYKYFYVYPAKHFVINEDDFERALQEIEGQLKIELSEIEDPIIAHRLKQRTLYDLEMIRETGTCKGIENYSPHFDGRKAGEQSFCLLDYFPKDFLMIIDESHRTLPQIHGMYNGDRARKKNLIDYGFRLSSAYDNRPLTYEEFEKYFGKSSVVFVSATPGDYEYSKSDSIVEQIIRPTGLIDPEVEVRPIKGQIEDVKKEIEQAIQKGSRVLLTTLTKNLAEELTDYLASQKIKTRYLHSEIDTLERTEIIRELRLGTFDVLVGINLLREGIDIPEVGFVGVLDADKEGFLRDYRSLIQIIGRAARNSEARVVLYADHITGSIKQAMTETARRRTLQLEYNKQHGIVPKTVVKPIKEKRVEIKDVKHIPKTDIPNLLIQLDAEMKEAANALNFEQAIALRDKMRELEKRMN